MQKTGFPLCPVVSVLPNRNVCHAFTLSHLPVNCLLLLQNPRPVSPLLLCPKSHVNPNFQMPFFSFILWAPWMCIWKINFGHFLLLIWIMLVWLLVQLEELRSWEEIFCTLTLSPYSHCIPSKMGASALTFSENWWLLAPHRWGHYQPLQLLQSLGTSTLSVWDNYLPIAV